MTGRNQLFLKGPGRSIQSTDDVLWPFPQQTAESLESDLALARIFCVCAQGLQTERPTTWLTMLFEREMQLRHRSIAV